MYLLVSDPFVYIGIVWLFMWIYLCVLDENFKVMC